LRDRCDLLQGLHDHVGHLEARIHHHRQDADRLYADRPVAELGGDGPILAIEFLLTAKRDAAAAKRFFQKALSSPGNPVLRVINVDKNPAFPPAVEALKAEGILPRRVRLRQCKYLNNVVEQDHRTVKKRTWLAKRYGSFRSAWRTLQGIEAVNLIRKGRVRWVPKADAVAAASFIDELFGIAERVHPDWSLYFCSSLSSSSARRRSSASSLRIISNGRPQQYLAACSIRTAT
jgi:hypothetical protein